MTWRGWSKLCTPPRKRTSIAEGGLSSAAHVDPERDRLVAEAAEAKRRSWQRDVLMAAVGVVLGVVATLIVVGIT